ncbi:hypothetical protein M2164_004792 [Streptomyces sp. SAI-208]|nr:hypothetical protein [Streptomyces sp. SAI-208]
MHPVPWSAAGPPAAVAPAGGVTRTFVPGGRPAAAGLILTVMAHGHVLSDVPFTRGLCADRARAGRTPSRSPRGTRRESPDSLSRRFPSRAG